MKHFFYCLSVVRLGLLVSTMYRYIRKLRFVFFFLGAADTLPPLEEVAPDDSHGAMPQLETVRDDWVHIGDDEEAKVSPSSKCVCWGLMVLTIIL